jgi:hypothetical protein
MRYLYFPYGFGVLMSAAGCGGPAEIPSTPDLSALLASYDAPSAMLDGDTVMTVLDDAPPLQDLAAGFRSTNYVVDGVDKVSGSTGERASDRIRLQGAIHVTMRCPGALGAPVYDAATNGTFSLTIAVAQNAIRRVIGGQATNCALRGTLLGRPIPVKVDGPVALDLGGDISLRSRWSGRLLVSLPGELTIDDRLVLTNLSARYDDNSFEHLFHLPNGSTVVIAVTSDSIRVRARNGSWVCNEAHSCIPE